MPFSTGWRTKASISSIATVLPQAETTPPVRRMLEMGVPVGLGTDATRVASYNPWVALSWLVTGATVGGLTLYPERNRLDRQTALELYTKGSAWMSREDEVKGSIAPGQYADFTALSVGLLSRCLTRRFGTSSPSSQSLTARSSTALRNSRVLRRHCRPPRPIGRRFGDTVAMQRRLARRLKQQRRCITARAIGIRWKPPSAAIVCNHSGGPSGVAAGRTGAVVLIGPVARALGFLIILSLNTAAAAQSTADSTPGVEARMRPQYQLLRDEEDWSFLADRSRAMPMCGTR